MRASVKLRLGDARFVREIELPLGADGASVTIDEVLFALRAVLEVMQGYSRAVALVLDARTDALDALCASLRRRLQPHVAAAVSSRSAPAAESRALTPREIDVLDLIMKGFTNKEIADRLSISFETVKCHRRHILDKSGARNTAALVHHYRSLFEDHG